MFLPIMILPYMVMFFKLSAWWVIPSSFLWLSYLHHQKVRFETKTALELASDPQALLLIQKHLPPWFSDAETERAVWVTKLLQKVWLQVSGEYSLAVAVVMVSHDGI